MVSIPLHRPARGKAASAAFHEITPPASEGFQVLYRTLQARRWHLVRQSTVAEGQSAPNFAIYRTGHRTIYWAHLGAGSNNDPLRSGPQHDTGLYDATGRI